MTERLRDAAPPLPLPLPDRVVLAMTVTSDAEPLQALLSCVDEANEVYELTVDGIPQSRLWLQNPTRLEYGYVRQIARLLDAGAAAGHPLTVVHLGGGALTLARYVAATRPGSRQIVVESQRLLSEAVMRALPLARPVEFVFGDAREVVETRGWSMADVTVVDLWSGAFIASRVASLEFYRLVGARVAPGGVVAVNLLDGPGFRFAKGQVAALGELFENVAVVLDERMLGNSLIGNVLVFATDRRGGGLDSFGEAHTWFADEPDPVVVLTGDALDRWVGTTRPAVDADGCDSPPPDESYFDEFRGRPFFENGRTIAR